jgi:quinone-modifying oxidoreductase subunit QmoB
MEDHIGVFICTGYGIAEALDIDALYKVATEEGQVAFCKKIESCEKLAIESINRDIESRGLNKVVIAGVSPRRYTDDMFPSNIIVEKIPIREHVVLSQPPNEEDTQMMAEDYLRMYIAKIKKVEQPVPYKSEDKISKDILVVGGGISGLTAASEAAKTGYNVRLVEKSDKLGGWLARQHKSMPTKPPFRELEDVEIGNLIKEVEKNNRIKIYKSARTGKIKGAPGLFDVTLMPSLNGAPDTEPIDTFRVGSIIQATGWKPKPIDDSIPYAKMENVVRNVDLEEMVKSTGKITRPSDGKDVKNIAFIQCGGSRSNGHHSYCSSICCLTSIKQAMYLREKSPDAKAYIFYEFIRTPGLYEDFYRRAQEDPGIFFTKGDIEEVIKDKDGTLLITVKNTMPGESIQVKVDLIVMATGMAPNSADGEAIRTLHDAKITMSNGESEAQRKAAEEKVDTLKEHEGTEVLNLVYRQGPDLPTLEYKFPDSHFICFPYESRRTGIYPAGAVRSPMDSLGSIEDATGAALKAIQCMEMTSRGEAVHPRSGDKSYPEFFLQKCTQCKRCTEECPFGVLNEDDKGTPLLQATRCRRCGVCMGACPERIVSFKDFSVSIITAMIKAVNVPDEFEEKPRILALMCENDAFPAMDLMGQHHLKYSPFIRAIPIRCLGSVNSVWITDAISAGYDGVILIGCKYGDDYQCHFCKGSELADYRSGNIREKLEQMSMEDKRLELHQLQISDYERLPEIFNNFAAVIEEIGMNPFKGM